MQRNALVISSVRGDTRRYRALHLVEQLELLGLHCQFVHLMDLRIGRYLKQPWDLVVLHRLPYSNHVRSILKKLQENNTIILSDFDDLIFDLRMFEFINSPDFSDPVRASMYKENMAAIRMMLDKSEGAVTSTDYLAEKIRELGKPTWVHRNAFSTEMMICAERAYEKRQALHIEGSSSDNRPVVIGYASGTLTHNRDFEIVRPLLKQVLERFPCTELWLIGPLDAGDDWGQLVGRIRRLPRVPWRNLPTTLSQFDINIAPLVANNPFSQSKSEIKYMEAGMVGVPTVASSTDAFSYAIRSGENGFLASNAQEWVDLLSKLILDPRLRKKMGESAFSAIYRNYHPITRAEQLAVCLEEISQQLHGTSFWRGKFPSQKEIEQRAKVIIARNYWLPAHYENDPSYVQMGIYTLLHSGVRITSKHVWIFLRRLFAPFFPFYKH